MRRDNRATAYEERDLVQCGGNINVLAPRGAPMGIMRKVVVVGLWQCFVSSYTDVRGLTNLILSEINRCFCHILFGNRLDEQPRSSNVVLIVNLITSLVLGEHDVVRPEAMNIAECVFLERTKNHSQQDRHPSDGSLTECSIPNWYKGVSQSQNAPNHAPVRFFEEIRFSSLGVDMCMRPEERSERADLVPSHQHVRFGIPEETANVG